MVFYLVTGVNRGIGLALVDNLSQDDSNVVIGTVRNLKNAQSVLDLKRSNIHLIEVDFALSQEEITAAFKKLEELAPNGLDTIIHNAGVLGAPTFTTIDKYDAEDYLFPFKINVIGSIKFYKAIAPYFYKGDGVKRLGFISSLAGLITGPFPFHGYGASKAALNYFMRQVFLENSASQDPIKKDTVVLAIHPGLVETDMASENSGGGSLPKFTAIKPAESAEGIIKVLHEAESGLFVSYDGTVLTF